MSIDHRTRRSADLRALSVDEIADDVLPTAIAAHGALAARGINYAELPSLGFVVDGQRPLTLHAQGGTVSVATNTDDAGIVAELTEDALSHLVQDEQSTMGLAMTARVRITRGDITSWISWEPALRALLDGRKVHESGDVTLCEPDGSPLDVTRSFGLDDDRDEMAHFLTEAGFLHLRGVFDPDEMATVADDIDEWIARARPDDGDSWWAEDADGNRQAVRVLQFLDKSAALRDLAADERFADLADLTGDGHRFRGGAEGLVKPLGIVKGLSDLPWHKDCGQGRHSYQCNSMTCGISVTGADRVSGALGVIPGSHRANTTATALDPRLDLKPLMLETVTGDVTVHCSDTLHRAHPPVERPRKVVYTSFVLPPLPGDSVVANPRYSKEARAELTSVQDRIAAADNPDSQRRYAPGVGRWA
ncbi:MAG: phytanoyl-CoA dioxygenase family protein [Acidimicrobiales bacterium]|nr:phytanoyl-CoA dioxygenase family protein [Acidimicrobiales bacterium]